MKNTDSFKTFVWRSFKKSYVLYMTILGFVGSIIFWIFKPDGTVELKYAVTILFIILITLLTFIHLSYSLYKSRNPQLPAIIFGREPYGIFVNTKGICLLEPSDLFSYDSFVSFYYIGDEQFEQQIGIGSVVNIQDNKRIQVVIEEIFEGQENIVERLKNNDKSIMSKVIVKPNIPKSYLALIRGV